MDQARGGFMPLLGRILLSLIFIMSAFNKIGDFQGTAQYMASQGMPAVTFFLVMAIIFELVGGLFVLTGLRTHIGALLLIVFLIPATLIFHNFWAYSGMEKQMQLINFMKNLAIIGGLLLLAGLGPGRMSVDVIRGRQGQVS